MPNWCWNSVSVSHEDPEMMKKFDKGIENGNLFETLVPLSTKDDKWEYFTALNEWGTKWDISNGSFYVEEDGKSGSGGFDTAWSPPIQAYEKLAELGFQISADYHEPGMCFAGTWNNEDRDDCYEYDFENEDWRDGIDNADVLELLEAEYESWKQWRDEDEAEFGNLKEQDDGA